MIADNVAKAITWARNPKSGTHISDVLPRQVAALQTLAAAINLQASTLDAEGQEAVEAVVRDSAKLARIVQRHLADA